jgi:helicase MOV-10
MSPALSTTSQGENVVLDVYAKSFVREFLLTINNSHPPHVYSLRKHSFDIDFEKYIRSFAGTDFLKQVILEPTGVLNPPLNSGHVVDNLSVSKYHDFFSSWLKTETDAFKAAQSQYDLCQFQISFSKKDRPAEVVLTASLILPGLAENSPFLKLGDIIHLRPLFLDDMHRGPLQYVQKYDRGAYINAQFYLPGWNGDMFHAEITTVRRAKETVEIQMSFASDIFPLTRSRLDTKFFNVQFPVRKDWRSSLWRAIRTASENLSTDGDNETSSHCWLEKMLFPDALYGKSQTKLNAVQFRFEPIDQQLNYEQLRAVDSVMRQNYGTVPFLIQGPPGTGKTKTLVEMTLQLLSVGVAKHILVCAPSDPAADTLAERLNKLLPPTDLLRLNSPSRTFAEVPDRMLPYCYIDDDRFGIPPFKTMMKYKVVVMACRDADLLIQARLTNRALFDLEVSMLSVLRGDDQAWPSLHWQALLIDEAAQATEPEALIPLTVVSTPPKVSEAFKAPIFIMAGDQEQLGPRTASQHPSVRTSLFERLLNRSLYSDHPLARRHLGARKAAARPLTKSMLPIMRPPFSNLIRNYRSHSAILAVPNALFYYDTLLPEASNTESMLGWEGWRGSWPVLFSQSGGQDEIEQEGGGWYNISEVKKAYTYASSLLKSGLVDQNDICVMSPFSAQVRRLRLKFRGMGLHHVNIGPIEAFQGLESRIVILCTTRSRTRFLDQDKARGFGIINEPKRFNVAITRAKQGLIVIGAPEVLSIDVCWRAFLDFCVRNDLYAGHLNEQAVATAHNAPLPILERVLKQRASQPEPALLGITGELEDDMWIRGVTDDLPDDDNDDEEDDDDNDDDDFDKIHGEGDV